MALCYTILSALVLGLIQSVHAQDVPSALSQSASQAAVCSGCHGKSPGIVVPALVSDKRVLEQQMLALRHEDGASAMHRLIHAYDDAQIRGIAEALESFENPPTAQSTGP